MTWLQPGHRFTARIEETCGTTDAEASRFAPQIDRVSQTIKVFATPTRQADHTLLTGMSGVATLAPPGHHQSEHPMITARRTLAPTLLGLCGALANPDLTAAQLARPPERRAAGNPTFVLVNGTSKTIQQIYAALATQGGWGRNRLDGQKLKPGERFNVTFALAPTCSVNIKVVFEDGTSNERSGIDTCGVQTMIWR